MHQTTVILPGEEREHAFHIPTHRLGEIISPRQVTAQEPLVPLVRRALSHPLGCSPLSETALAGHKVLVVVDDITRGTPTSDIIPILLEYLGQAGCREKDISFALALGTHRPMTDDEIAKKLGLQVANQFEVINTPAQERQAFVDTGKSWGGVPIEVHRAVLEADIVVGLGSVAPHSDAGWSGGCKIILPGMCSERTVMENHYINAQFPGNLLGRELTPIRENMEGVVEQVGLDYVLNVAMTPYGDVIDVMGGHFISAQRAAARVARKIFSVPFTQRTDVVVANAYPAAIDLWQACGGIWAGELMVKPGGTVVLNAACPEGVGPHAEFLQCMGLEPQKILDLVSSGNLKDKTVAGVALQVARMLKHMRLVIVSSGLSAAEVNAAGFTHFESIQDAVDDVLTHTGPAAGLSVITHSRYTYPVQH
jgi:nickel-dependent lactate racemase